MASASNSKKQGAVGGIILIVVGVIFLLNSYGIETINLGKLWPLFLIIPGIAMVYNHLRS